MNKLSRSGKTSIYLLLLSLCTMMNSCGPSIALYDQYAYTQATSLKVDLQNLIDESVTVDFATAKADIDRMNTEVEKAYEYAKGRSKNAISTKQYEILRGENNFYRTFLKTWKAQGKLTEAGAGEIKIKMGQLMDTIIELENGKNRNK